MSYQIYLNVKDGKIDGDVTLAGQVVDGRYQISGHHQTPDTAGPILGCSTPDGSVSCALNRVGE